MLNVNLFLCICHFLKCVLNTQNEATDSESFKTRSLSKIEPNDGTMAEDSDYSDRVRIVQDTDEYILNVLKHKNTKNSEHLWFPCRFHNSPVIPSTIRLK